MTPFAKRTLAICLLTSMVETTLLLTMAAPVLLLFVLGPPAFLAVIAWRRRTHLARSRRLASIAVSIGAFGIAAMAVAAFLARQNPNPHQASIAPLAVPLVQWLFVLFTWIIVAREESRENREKPPASS